MNQIMIIISGVLLILLLYYLFFRDERLFDSVEGQKFNTKLWVIVLVLGIRLVALYFTNGDVYVFLELTKTTMETGYPYVEGLPEYVSYWSDHNPLHMYVCHPPLVFYMYSPVIALIGQEGLMIFTVFLFLLSLHVLWNWFEREGRDPLIPCLLYGTFPLFYLESLTHISVNIALVAILAVGITSYLEYERTRDASRLKKACLCFALAPLIEYSAIVFMGFFSLYLILKRGLNNKALVTLVILFIIWLPFVSWNIFADFPIFHSYAFTYTHAHHFNENLPYGNAVRTYYSMHKDAIIPFYLMDTEFFAFINFAIFLNGNLLLLGSRQKRGWGSIVFLAIFTQLLILTYYAVIGYQSHPLANFARYIIPSAFLIVPLSLRWEFKNRWKRIAIALIALNIVFDFVVVINGSFQWVSMRWIGPYQQYSATMYLLAHIISDNALLALLGL